MDKPNPVLDKSYAFALKIVPFCLKIQSERKEYVLTKQLLKSGTSVGANVEEAEQAQSKKDFISKLSIALKEAHETRFWLRLMRDTKIAQEKETNELIEEIHQIIKLLVAIIKSSKID